MAAQPPEPGRCAQHHEAAVRTPAVSCAGAGRGHRMSRPDEPVSPGGQEEAWFADDRWPVDRPDADPTRSARTPSAVPDPLTAHAPAPAEAPQWTKFGSTHSAEPSILPPTPPTADVPASAFAQPSGPSA